MKFETYNESTNVASERVTWSVVNSENGHTAWGDGATSTQGEKNITLNSLIPNTRYWWSVSKICKDTLGNEYDPATPGQEFTTLDGACRDIWGFRTMAVTASRATVQWDVLPKAIEYRLAYRVNGSDWKVIENITEGNITSSGANKHFNFSADLHPSTLYDVAVSARCGSGWGNWTHIESFTTKAL